MESKAEKPKSVEQRLRDGEAIETSVVIDELWRLQAGWDNERSYSASLRHQVIDEAPTVHQIAADIFVRWCAKKFPDEKQETAEDAYELAASLRSVRLKRILTEREARMRELCQDGDDEESSNAAE